jgi:hypothetical protein
MTEIKLRERPAIADRAMLVTGANRGFGHAERREEDIFPDPTSEVMAESWRSDAPKAVERQRAALVA